MIKTSYPRILNLIEILKRNFDFKIVKNEFLTGNILKITIKKKKQKNENLNLNLNLNKNYYLINFEIYFKNGNIKNCELSHNCFDIKILRLIKKVL